MKTVTLYCVLSLSLLSACNRGGEVRPGHYVINKTEYDDYIQLMIEEKRSTQRRQRQDLLEKYFEVDCALRDLELVSTSKPVQDLILERDKIQLQLQEELKFVR